MKPWWWENPLYTWPLVLELLDFVSAFSLEVGKFWAYLHDKMLMENKCPEIFFHESLFLKVFYIGEGMVMKKYLNSTAKLMS